MLQPIPRSKPQSCFAEKMLRFYTINALALVVFFGLLLAGFFGDVPAWLYILFVLIWILITAIGSFQIKWNYHLQSLNHNFKTSENHISITFDDGYATTLSIAAPLLVEHDMPFHVFVSPGLVESGDPRYLNRRQLKEISQVPGATIGAHGYHHVPLSSLSPLRQLEDLSAAKRWIEDVIQKPVTTMSYPFGDTPSNVQSVVRKSGYSIAACSIWGFNVENTDRFMLKRIDCWNGDSARTVTTKLLGYWNWISMRSLA